MNDIKKNANFIIDYLTGRKIPTQYKIRIKERNLGSFRQIYSDPGLMEEPSQINSLKANHFYSVVFVNALFYKLIPSITFEFEGKMRNLILNHDKIGHQGSVFNWEGCVAIKANDKITEEATCTEAWFDEERALLFLKFLIIVNNQEKAMVCKITSTVTMEEGSF